MFSRISGFGLAALFGFAFSGVALAEVKMALPFTDLMIFQRGMSSPVFGTADPGEQISVEFGGQKKTTTADSQGKWLVKLDPMEANAQGRALRITGKNVIEFKDVLVGEVWLCSGQSNMEISLERLIGKNIGKATRGTFNSPEEKAAVVARIEKEVDTTTPGIRLFQRPVTKGVVGIDKWTECNSEALKNQVEPLRAGFSATAYFFAKSLHSELKVPVGVIQAAVGGSMIESWAPAEVFSSLPNFKNEPVGPGIKGRHPGRFYSTMIEPLEPFAIRGAVWYQGESNVEMQDGLSYADKLEALIRTWRSAWKQPDMPFYYVQLPRFEYAKRPRPGITSENLAWLREGQRMAQRVPRTGMVVSIDTANVYDIHPFNKWDIGYRLALQALVKTYGRKDLACSGPVYRSMETRGDKIVLQFDEVARGLVSRDKQPLTEFTIAGADQKFFPAEATIEGEKVVVSSKQVPKPVAVRFAWDEKAFPNLANSEGLPAGPFRTDNWPEPKIELNPTAGK